MTGEKILAVPRKDLQVVLHRHPRDQWGFASYETGLESREAGIYVPLEGGTRGPALYKIDELRTMVFSCARSLRAVTGAPIVIRNHRRDQESDEGFRPRSGSDYPSAESELI